MGRRRTCDLDLPRYISRKGAGYYFVTRGERKWIPLGSDRAAALAAHRTLLAALGYGEPQGLLPDGYSVRFLLGLVRRSARSRGLENLLTIEDVGELVHRANGRCEVSGIVFSGERDPGQRIRVYGPSVDRIDSSRGYALGNCRLVCAGVNVALNRFGEGLLLAMRGVARTKVRIAGIVEGVSTNPSVVENDLRENSA
jgi:hypothetical protein